MSPRIPPLLTFAGLLAPTVLGQTLVKDINTTPPTNPPSISSTAGVAAGNQLFFAASDQIYGLELWVSDGTGGGTRMVVDLAPGSSSGGPAGLFAFGALVLFSANDGVTGGELWRSDGTAAGTFLLRDLAPGAGSSSPTVLGSAGGLVYFTAADPVVGRELFATDGTANGTVLVRDLFPGLSGSTPNSSNPAAGITAGSTFFFTANDGVAGTELWAVTGTNVVLVKDINPGAGLGSSPAGFAVMGNQILFTANDGVNGTEPWVSDGTPAGTVLLKDIQTAAGTGSSPGAMVVVGATAYFAANDGSSGAELWKTDGTQAGTVLVADLVAGSGGSTPSLLTAVGGLLFFVATTPANGRELYTSDGTTAGTAMVVDLTPGTGSTAFPPRFTPVGNRVPFPFNDGVNGSELWASDGTAAGTAMVRDINATAPNTGSNPLPGTFAVLGSRLFLFANDGIVGTELWASDLTQAGTVLVKDIAPPQPSSSSPGFVLTYDDKLLLSANDGINGSELWITDGTAAGTVLVADINPGSAGSSPGGLVVFRGKAYFSAAVTAGATITGRELWVTDGTAAGTSLVKDINPGSSDSSPTFAVVLGDAFYFIATEATTGRELWRSDGTAQGTYLVKDFAPGTGNGLTVFTNALAVLGNRLLIAANDGVVGQEFWVSDGTTAGTTLVLDLGPGSASGVAASAFSLPMIQIAGTLCYFAGNDGVNGTELWKTDGTAAGTVLVKDINPGAASSSPQSMGVWQGRVYGQMDDGVSGPEPWVSDGTAAGTVLLKDITVGATGSQPVGFFAANDRVVFVANNRTPGQETGSEPWASDGTTAGTQMVRDVNPGPAGSWTVFGLVGKGRRFALVATDGQRGNEHWISDCTAAGTVMLADLRPGPLGGAATGWWVAGDKWFVVANDGTTGNELWVYPARQTGIANAELFGVECAGQAGRPTLTWSGAPVTGNPGFATGLDGAPPQTGAALFLSPARANLALGTCTLYTALPAVALPGLTDATGHATQALGIPADTALVGGSTYLQWVVIDPQGGFQSAVSLSAAARIVVGAP